MEMNSSRTMESMNQLIVKVDLILYCNPCLYLAVLYCSCCVDISNYARLANFVCMRLSDVITQARTTLDQNLNNTDYSLVLKQNKKSKT